MDYKMVKEVKKRVKFSSKVINKTMAVCCVFFLLGGIMFDRGLMLLSLLSALLYFVFQAFAEKEYEYIMEGNRFTIFVIHGKRYRKQAHELDLAQLEVVAPNWHEAVSRYRIRTGIEKLKKYDYTSYDPEIPYYTMIIMENRRKIKLLLDLDEDMLRSIKRLHPQKVFVQ